MSSSPHSGVRTTRTGRRVVPTPAAAAALAAEKEKTAEKTAGADKEKDKAATPTRTSGRGAAASKKTEEKEPTKVVAAKEKEKESAGAAPPKPAVKEKEAASPTRRGLRSVRAPSESNEESGGEAPASPAKRAKISEELEEHPGVIIVKEEDIIHAEDTDTHIVVQHEEMETQEITDDSQIFAAVAKMNQHVQGEEDHQRTAVASAVDSILPDNNTTIATIVQNPDGTQSLQTVEVQEFQGETIQTVELNPPWNEQGCIICNVDINFEDPAYQSPKSEQLKEFFLEFFSVGDQISLEDENAFPFCSKCAEDMEGLLNVSQNIESMHRQFNKVRDSMAKKAVKTFLSRTKPNCLEEDAKVENYGYLDEEQRKTYKEQMFNLWKSRFELVQPGPKTPIMIRSMDSRGRVTVVRLNSHGQAVPDRFGGVRGVVRSDAPLGGMGRITNGGDDEEDSRSGMGGGGALEIYQCKDCPKAFSAKSMLAEHERVHTGELPYECDQCGKAFSVPHYLMTHMKTHTGEKPYKCAECGKGFAQRGGLVTHSLVHTGAKPYSCQICGKSFRQKYHLTQHNLIHSGVKPFSCELCGKAFNVKMNLREHMRRHTGDRPYKCPYCTTVGFFRKKMLKDHITKAHPQRPMPEELMAPEPSTSQALEDIQDDDNEDMEDLEEGEIPLPDAESETVST